jgi:hypothetical protein
MSSRTSLPVRISFLFLSIFLLMGTRQFSVALHAQEAKPNDTDQTAAKKVSKKPLNEERLKVYRDFLKTWRRDEYPTLNISIELDTIESTGPTGDEDCLKGLDAEVMPAQAMHQFLASDAGKLGEVNINLVDPDLQMKEVEKNDPWSSIQKGNSVDDAVKNGFSHGLLTFSEIQFDKNHSHAILTFGFYCGRECGNGGTILMSKTDAGIWKPTGRCHQWIASAKQVIELNA